MGNGKVYIYVDPKTPDTPWILRYEDPNSANGFNEVRVLDLEIRSACKGVVVNDRGTRGMYQLECIGRVCMHPTLPKAIIQSGSLPLPW